MRKGASGRLLLGRGFEEELVHLADGQALGQVIKGAVFGAAVVAMAVGLAAPGETLHQGSAQGVGADLQLGKQAVPALGPLAVVAAAAPARAGPSSWSAGSRLSMDRHC